MKDRLKLNNQRLNDMAQGILDVVKLEDPTRKVFNERTLDNGLVVQKVSVPLGVIAIIYESRPNVTSDAATLCIKSGNTCILRIGKEAWNSTNAIVQALQEGIQKCGVNPNIVQLIQDTTHQSANELMEGVGYIDLLIPRGGKNLISRCVEHARLFTQFIDSAAVYVNCSTLFTDGGQFGLGCEIGISTQKLHARGPMGLEELTTYKYIVQGNGQIR